MEKHSQEVATAVSNVCFKAENLEENTNKITEGTSSDRSKITGPRGNRLILFNKVMEKSLQKLIADASFHRFSHTFHPFYKKNPQVTENIHKQFIEDLQKSIQEDINRVIEEGQLQSCLEELDKLEDTAKNYKENAWRPTGVPEEDLCCFLMPYYQKQQAYIRRELKKIQEDNATLAQMVEGGRESITKTEQRIAVSVDEWKASATEFQKIASSLCPPDTFNVK